MKNVEKDVRMFDETVMKCFYNTCKYYGRNVKIIYKYINKKIAAQNMTFSKKI